jgi:hypothetical protein
MTEQEIEQDRNCHYDLQSSIGEPAKARGVEARRKPKLLPALGERGDSAPRRWRWYAAGNRLQLQCQPQYDFRD